jgi:NitT/TauT family transport system permease protein
MSTHELQGQSEAIRPIQTSGKESTGKQLLKSEKYRTYLQKQKRHVLLIRLSQAMVLIGFLALWELAVRLKWVDAMLTSRPSMIYSSFLELMTTGGLAHHMWVTTQETLFGFLLSMILGTLIAILFWSFTFLAKVMDPYVVILNALPKVALGPIFYIWLGDRWSIYGMAVAISIIVTIMMMEAGFQEISRNRLKLMESFGATRWQMLRMVILPASIPNFVATMKVNVGLTFVGVIMGEFLSSKAGLGYLIIYGGQVFQMHMVMTSIAMLALLSIIFYGAVNVLGKSLRRIYHFD